MIGKAKGVDVPNKTFLSGTAAALFILFLMLSAQHTPAQPAKGRLLGLPPVDCPGDNSQTDQKILLGKKLFFDKTLSADKTRACASCHLPMIGFSDSDKFSFGVDLETGDRHSLSVLNAAAFQHLMWDGRANSLEEQALMPFRNRKEMNMTESQIVAALRKEGLEPDFKKAFGGDITPVRVAAAIACFERTLMAGDSAFDRYYYLKDETAMTNEEKHGLQIFNRSACASCHSIGEKWSMFTDQKFHDIGVGCRQQNCDTGRFAITHNKNDWAAFRTPSLRNVALRQRYFHDGSADNLEQAVDFHLKGGIKNKNLDPLLKPVALTPSDKKDLLAFMQALTSKDIDAVVKGALPKFKAP